jgi:hypothetical protein
MTAADGTPSASGPPETRAPPAARAAAPPPAAASATAPPASAGVPASPGLPALSRLLGSVVAPTTLLTALLYYFGYMHAWFYFGYFGLNSTVLGFGSVDYLMQSVDALFIPVTGAAIAGLLALWGNALLVPRLRARRNRRVKAGIARGIAAAGAALAVACVILTFATSRETGTFVPLAPLGFGMGVLVTAYAVHLHRVLMGRGHREDTASGWAQATEWAVVFALVGISLFAAATDYASAVGQTRAGIYVTQLSSQPAVVLYSKDSLSITQPGVTQTRCGDPKAAYQFRYDGLTLMLESGGKYVLIPHDWTSRDGVAIVLAESETTRLEFYSSAQPPARTTC